MNNQYLSYIDRFSSVNIMVIGDLILDEYIFTEVNRISPEAPVQVCLIKNKKKLLGGSANVANNIISFGGKCIPIGIVGDDKNGKELLNLLEKKGMPIEGITIEHKRPTTTKSRIIAHNQQLLRLDNEDTSRLGKEVKKKILFSIEEFASQVQAIILEDYGKGVICKEVIQKSIEISKKYNLPIIVDPKIENFRLYRDITLMTPNNFEASYGSGIKIKDKKSLIKAGKKLIEKLNMKALLITQGSEGMTLFTDKGEKIVHIPTVAKEVYDVTGAGDTVVALMGMVLSLNSEDFYRASIIANAAAGIVVGKIGTATVSPEELKKTLKENHFV